MSAGYATSPSLQWVERDLSVDVFSPASTVCRPIAGFAISRRTARLGRVLPCGRHRDERQFLRHTAAEMCSGGVCVGGLPLHGLGHLQLQRPLRAGGRTLRVTATALQVSSARRSRSPDEARG